MASKGPNELEKAPFMVVPQVSRFPHYLKYAEHHGVNIRDWCRWCVITVPCFSAAKYSYDVLASPVQFMWDCLRTKWKYEDVILTENRIYQATY